MLTKCWQWNIFLFIMFWNKTFLYNINTTKIFIWKYSWLITGFVTRLTRRVPLVEQELLTLPEHLSSHPVFSGVRVTRALIFCICFVDRCLSFCLLFFWSLCCLFFCLLIIVLSVLLRYTASDYPFGIFNLFLIND